MVSQAQQGYRASLVCYLTESDTLGRHTLVLGALRELDMSSHAELAELAAAASNAQREEGKPGSPLKAIVDFCAVLRVIADGDDPDREKLVIDAGGYEYVDWHGRTYSQELEESVYFAGPREHPNRPQPWYPEPSDESKEWHSWMDALNDPMCSKYSWSAQEKRRYVESKVWLRRYGYAG